MRHRGTSTDNSAVEASTLGAHVRTHYSGEGGGALRQSICAPYPPPAHWHSKCRVSSAGCPLAPAATRKILATTLVSDPPPPPSAATCNCWEGFVDCIMSYTFSHPWVNNNDLHSNRCLPAWTKSDPMSASFCRLC